MDERLLKVVGAFLKQIEPLSKVQPSDLQYFPLKSGNSSATLYRFDLAMKSYVIRLFPPQANHKMRMHQISLASQAGKVGVGPEIFFVDPLFEGIIMAFIPGRTVLQTDFESMDQLAQFARFLQKLHRSNVQFPLAPSPFQRFHDFCLKGEQQRITFPSRFSDVRAVMKVLEVIFLQNPLSPVPTHLDLHPLNIMMTDGRFSLVDWVNGGMSDPYFDLATFTTFVSLNEAQKLAFLTYYFERAPTPHEWSRFIITQPIRLFVTASILLSLLPDESRPLSYDEALHALTLPSIGDFVKSDSQGPLWQFGLTMFKTGLDLIDSDEFIRALERFKTLDKV